MIRDRLEEFQTKAGLPRNFPITIDENSLTEAPANLFKLLKDLAALYQFIRVSLFMMVNHCNADVCYLSLEVFQLRGTMVITLCQCLPLTQS